MGRVVVSVFLYFFVFLQSMLEQIIKIAHDYYRFQKAKQTPVDPAHLAPAVLRPLATSSIVSSATI